ncbi:MAG: ABC transporter substrate-binding protein [Acidimicrobiia bacterium]
MVIDSHRTASRRRLARLAASVAALALVSTTFATSGGASAPDRRAHGAGSGGEITFGLENETDTANGYCLPRSQLAISGIQVAAAVYDTLMVPNTKGEYVPYLAEAVTPNADFTEYTIKLREGVTFHDGTPLDATALKLNLDTYSGEPGAPQSAPLFSSFLQKLLVSNDIVDDLTVLVRLTQPMPQYPSYLYGTGRFGIVAPAQLNLGDECATTMIGTGPFVCNEGCWTPGESTVLDANPDYWQEGYPKASKLTFVPVPESAQRLTALRGGELDVLHLDAAQEILQLDKVKSDFNLVVQKPGVREVRYYFMNSAKPPFDTLDGRLAVAYAIDRDEINQISNKGLFTLADGIMDVDAPGYLPDAGIPQFNLKKAKALVQKVIDATGSFDVTLLADTSDPSNVREAQIVKEQLEKAGMTVTLPPTAAQASFINDAIAGNFGLFLWRMQHGGATNMIDVDLVPWFGDGSLVNFGRVEDAGLEDALQAGRLTTDINERTDFYETVNQTISENVYILPMWYVDWTIGSAKNVKVKLPKLPDGGGKPLFVYGRIPVLGIAKG